MWPPSSALLNTTTSYPEPIAIPSAQPGDSPTFCVPINAQWIPIVAGALQQLAQTNIWSGMTQDDALAAVGAAWDLIASVANATACTVFSLKAVDCDGLEYSTDGGTTWTIVPGWRDYVTNCLAASTGGGGGAPPPDVTVDGPTLACNMAGYLIQTLLRQVVMDAIQKVLNSGFLVDVIDTIVALIPGIDAATPLVIAATDALFTALSSGSLATIAAGALTDLVWSKLGCVIYNALNPFIGWTTGAVAAVASAITGSALAPDAVLALLVNYLNGLGIPALQSITAPAYVTTYDCSQCGMGGTQIQAGPAGLRQIPNLIVTDGTTTIQPTGMITVVGATVSGTSPNATITIPTPPTPAPSDAGSVIVTISEGQAGGTAAVVFATTFTDVPDVVAGSASGQVIAAASDVTTTGFTLSLTSRFAVAADTPILASWSAGAAPGGGGGGGGSTLVVSDLSTTVTDVVEIDFAGAVVSDEGGGAALVTIPGVAQTLIAEIIVPSSGTPSDFDFTAIPNTYRHLRVYGVVRGRNSEGDDAPATWACQINGDTGANYAWVETVFTVRFGATTPACTGGGGATEIAMGAMGDDGGGPQDTWTTFVLDIPYYAQTFNHKAFSATITPANQSGVSTRLDGYWVPYNATPAITQLHFYGTSGFTIGGKISLYGVS